MKIASACAVTALSAATLVLGGCAAPPATSLVKDAVADPEAYLSAFGTVPATTLTQLPAGEAPVPFRRMEVNYKVREIPATVNGATSLRRDLTLKRVVTPGSVPGEVRHYDIWSNNGIPFRYNFRTSYRGLLYLKWQNVYLNRTNAEAYAELKSLQGPDTITDPGTASAKYSYSYRSSALASGPDLTGRLVCAFGSKRAARTIDESLIGDATELSCDTYGTNGALTQKEAAVYLHKYGIVFPLEVRDGNTTSDYEVKSVRIDWRQGSAPSSVDPSLN